MKKSKSLTSIPKWLAGLWRVPQVAYDVTASPCERDSTNDYQPHSVGKWAGKAGVIASRQERKRSFRTNQCHSETSGDFVTPRSSSSWTGVYTPPKSPSSEHRPEDNERHGARSSDRTLQQNPRPKQESREDHRSPPDRTSQGDLNSRAHSTSSVGSRAHAQRSWPRRLTLDVRKLIEQRTAVLGVRIRVRESRHALRNNREDLVDRNAQFYQDLRNLAATSSGSELKALLSQYDNIQDFRDEVQLKESDYNVLEDELNRKEWEMKEDETKLYQRLNKVERPFLDEQSDSFSERESGYVASSSSTVSAPSIVSPARRQWLSRIGDRDLILEQLHELRAERAQLVEEDRIREKFGLGLDEEARSFLNTFDVRHNSLQEDLAHIEAQISRFQEGISEQADILYSSSQFDGEIEATDQSPIESRPDDPLFLGNEEGQEAPPVFSNVTMDPQHGAVSTVSYINEWLLHILRRSSIEVRRFKTTETLRTLQLDPEHLARLVLEWWSKDETVNLFPKARNHTAKSVSITSRTKEPEATNRATRSDSVLFNVDRNAQSLRFGGARSKTEFRPPNIVSHPHYTSASSL